MLKVDSKWTLKTFWRSIARCHTKRFYCKLNKSITPRIWNLIFSFLSKILILFPASLFWRTSEAICKTKTCSSGRECDFVCGSRTVDHFSWVKKWGWHFNWWSPVNIRTRNAFYANARRENGEREHSESSSTHSLRCAAYFLPGPHAVFLCISMARLYIYLFATGPEFRLPQPCVEREKCRCALWFLTNFVWMGKGRNY